MSHLTELVDDFLAQKRIAVTGVSRNEAGAANLIYHKLRDTGYRVFPVNPNAEIFEGDACYKSVASIPGGVDAVVVVNQPNVTDQIVHECAEAGIKRVWLHRAFHSMGSSFEPETVTYAEQHGMSVIAGGCPMMFCQPVDFGHKCMKWMLQATGNLPK